MWGMDDGTSWISAGNPCLFDWKLNAKKSFHAASDPDAFLTNN
jgi:GH35 family endo-1,4-beta-xylanase